MQMNAILTTEATQKSETFHHKHLLLLFSYTKGEGFAVLNPSSH
jgi:hypothetical protein